jgi:hypothetical protein
MSNKKFLAQDNPNTNEVRKLILSKDETAIVLKVHLYVEQKLEKIIEIIFPNSDWVLKQTFTHKVNILNSIGVLGERCYNNLICINKIRNKFSHKFGYTLTKKDLLDLKQIYKPNEINIPDKFKDQSLSNKVLLLGSIAAYFQGDLEYLAEISKELNPLSAISIEKFAEKYERKGLKKFANAIESESKNI